MSDTDPKDFLASIDGRPLLSVKEKYAAAMDYARGCEAEIEQVRAELQRALAREEGNLIAARALVEVRDALQERVTALETGLTAVTQAGHLVCNELGKCAECAVTIAMRALAGTGEGEGA